MADKVNEALERLENGVKDMFTSERFKTYLDVMSRFHNYSARNCVLIAMQNPNATYIAGYRDWQKNFNRQVRRGEKGLEILAPWTQTINVETDRTDDNGNIIYEKKQILRYRTVNVFDVSQTDGEELPKIAERLTGDVSDYSRYFDAIKELSDYDVDFEDMDDSGKNGYCNLMEHKIRIKSGLSQAHSIKTLIHEVTHEKIHGDKEADYRREFKSRMEVEAEGCAYVVCSYFGLDTSDYSFGYVTGWAAGQKNDVLKDALTNIRNTANELISGIEKNLEMQANLNKPNEKQITNAVNDVLNDAGFSGNAINSYIYNVRETASPDDIRMRVRSEYYAYDQIIILKDTTSDMIKDLLGNQAQFDYLDKYLSENNIEFEIQAPDENYAAAFDIDNNELNIYEDGKIVEKVNVLVEIKGEGKEDIAFKFINESKLKIGNTDIMVNPVKEDERLIYEPYIERLEEYENLGYDSSWPMVSISYSNVEGIPLSTVNINEAVKLINKLDDNVYSNPVNFVKIKISYVYNDWNYESVQDVTFEKGRMNFIDYLELPDNVISHLKKHNSIMEACNMAKNFAPDTTYGQEYFDKMLEWSSYCRMELNHNSEKPLLPALPQVNDMYKIEGLSDWRLEQ
ncbi:MAG: hypothetical protein IJ141_04495 [Lachnospiraceae bacterium]|nr:hypothetical protein [Lachnospiraceae bacterium]